MDLTEGNFEDKRRRSKIHMLWFAMISMSMTFAGLTSAYVVSKSRKDWLLDFEFPTAFIISTLVILASSATFYFSKKAIQQGNRSLTTLLLVATLVLGGVFTYLQFDGFGAIVAQGYFPTGSESTVTTSFIYAIVFVHLLHLAGGILSILIIIYNNTKAKYTKANHLGLELGSIYWHFVDFLWLYLFIFLYFFR